METGSVTAYGLQIEKYGLQVEWACKKVSSPGWIICTLNDLQFNYRLDGLKIGWRCFGTVLLLGGLKVQKAMRPSFENLTADWCFYLKLLHNWARWIIIWPPSPPQILPLQTNLMSNFVSQTILKIFLLLLWCFP